LDISASHNTASLTYTYSTTATRGPRGSSSDNPRNARHLSYRQLLQQRLQKYRLPSSYYVESSGPEHAQKYRVVFLIGNHWMPCSDIKYSKTSAAKEEAAGLALLWLNQYGYP
jgi:hypothetical protein